MHSLPLSEAWHREATRLCARTALLLMQHGAESALVESVTRRLGVALGVDQVEVALMANAVTVTTLAAGQCITTVRRNEDRGINMHMVTEVQRVMLDLEAGTLAREDVLARLDAIPPLRYPRWIVAPGIGLSCACFAALSKCDLPTCGVVFVASTLAMGVRQAFAPLHFNPLVTFFAAAFVATSVAAVAVNLELSAMPKVAMASSVLLLVPGFPLINGVSDMVKGYINTGISRLMLALMLAAATVGGILLAMTVWHSWGWS
jgi:uncharacterized membrane protein YjjP (DUF1212 family)